VSDLVRASDADRERAVASLREHLAQGRLSLAEFTQRMTDAYAATTSTELAELERDLPAGATAAPATRRRPLQSLVAIFGSTKRSGMLRVSGHVLCFALFGNVDLDLRGAVLEGDAVTVTTIAIFGASDVYVPQGVEVERAARARACPGALRRDRHLERSARVGAAGARRSHPRHREGRARGARRMSNLTSVRLQSLGWLS